MANITLSSLITPTNITGNAGTATVLQTARTIAISGAVTGTATSFNGSANITIPITSLDVGDVSITGILGVDHGGTGISVYTTGNYIYASGTGTLAQRTPAQVRTDIGAGTGNGTVTSVSVTTANGVSGSVATSTTTPAITLTLGAITPTSVAASGTVTGSNLSGTNTGNQTITLTGDVTGSGTGSFAATIANTAVTLAKMANIATTSLIGRSTAGTGVPEVISVGSGLTLSAGVLSASGGGGTVTSVSVTTANGVSGSVATSTTTPAITLTLGAITPSSVVSSGSITCSSGNITSPQNFISSTTASILATTGAGTVYLRPNGAGSATGELSVASTGATVINNQLRVQGTVRAQAETTSLSGEGIEMYYAASRGYVIAYDRTGSVWKTLRLYGSNVELYASGSLIQDTTTAGIAVTGAITATGNVTGYSSDRRLKSNLRVIESASSKLSRLNGYIYDWNKEVCDAVGFKPDHATEHGLIAQEVREVIFDATAPAPFNNEYLTVRYERVVPLIVAATNENTKKIEAIEHELAQLKQRLKENL